MSRKVSIDNERSRYLQTISIGPHLLHADEPTSAGGGDKGPGPYELLLAALGACTSITVRMYAERKGWPLKDVHIDLRWAELPIEDSVDGNDNIGVVEGIEMEIDFIGDLSDDQRSRLLTIAQRCPVHRTFSSPIQVRTQPALVAV